MDPIFRECALRLEVIDHKSGIFIGPLVGQKTPMSGDKAAGLPLRVSFSDVQEAARVLAGKAHRIPVLTSRTIDVRTGARIFGCAIRIQSRTARATSGLRANHFPPDHAFADLKQLSALK